MTPIEYTCFTLIGIAILVFFGWRIASRRVNLPCPVWLRWIVEFDNPYNKTYRAENIVENLELQPGMRVLDLGCGPGRLTLPLAHQVGPQGEVIAVDIQPAMLRRAQQKAQTANLANIRFVQARLGEGQLAVEQADRALLVTVLGEIPARARALGEIYAALKPGGWLSVTEIIMDPHFQRRETVSALASTAGFREVRFTGSRAAYTLILEKPSSS